MHTMILGREGEQRCAIIATRHDRYSWTGWGKWDGEESYRFGVMSRRDIVSLARIAREVIEFHRKEDSK